MRIAINGWRAHGTATGVRRYLLNVIRRWTPERLGGRFEGATIYCARQVDPVALGLPPGIEVSVLASSAPMLVWENTRFARAARGQVAFNPSFSVPLARPRPGVVTIHDAVMALHPELFGAGQRQLYNRLYRWSAHHASLVITDSEAAREDLARVWGVRRDRVRVVYLAPEEIFGPVHDAAAVRAAHVAVIGDEAPFFLFVGKLSGRRDVPALLEAFAAFRQRSRAYAVHRLLVVGRDIRGVDVLRRAGSLGLDGAVVHREHVPDADLRLLYNAALAYVAPSTYETTSLPVLEAQASRLPVATIDTAGMREVTGGAALLMPRAGARELAEAMERLAADESLRGRLADEGARNAARFSWDRAAADHLDALAEAAGAG